MTTFRLPARLGLALLGLAVLPAALAAQGNASSAAAGMGGNYTAMARNFNAIAWNAANLGQPGNSTFSLALSPQFGAGTGPITFADLNEYGGQVVPDAVRQEWMQRINDNDGQFLGGDVHVTPLALSVKNFALSATTTVRSKGVIPAAVAELLLFGNAGRTGSPQDYTAEELALDGNATTTIAAAFGMKLPVVPLGNFSIGVTGKYIIGHGLVSMRDNGSTITSNPLSVTLDAPLVMTDTAGDAAMDNGSGVGLDLAAAWTMGSFRFGAVLKDFVNTFAWKTENLYYIPVNATYDQSGSSSEIDSILPLSAAPAGLQQALRERVTEATPEPTVVLGAAYTGFRRLTLAADLRTRFGDGLELGPKTAMGVGAELKFIPFVPL
jgi:hypothetical protein